jgi:hypothetical protein
MELTTLVSPEEAADRLRHYQTQVREDRTVEDEAIIAGYRAASRGLPVISLPRVIGAGGFFEGTDCLLPKLAVARADATTCTVDTSQSYTREMGRTGTRAMMFITNDRSQPRGALVGRHHVFVSLAPDEYGPRPLATSRSRGQCVVPIIPPNLRPRARRLHLFHILWEVEKWDRTPPVDPALLRHIRGDLWSVVASWDLTPLERAVLAQRA